MPNPAPILALIEKETGFLPLQHVCFKMQTRFLKHNRTVEFLTDQDFAVFLAKPARDGLLLVATPEVAAQRGD